MSNDNKNNKSNLSQDEVVYDPNSENSSEESIAYDETDDGESTDSAVLLNKIKKIKSELDVYKKEKQEYLDGWQRSKADFINLKKRNEEDRKSIIKYATEEFIIELIPALDSFEMAFKNKESWEKAPPDWRMGIEFIYSQLKNVLTNHGVTEIDPLGEKFDPKLHHSIEIVAVENPEDDDKIVEVIQKGYKLGDKIIRHPNVKVGEKK